MNLTENVLQLSSVIKKELVPTSIFHIINRYMFVLLVVINRLETKLTSNMKYFRITWDDDEKSFGT